MQPGIPTAQLDQASGYHHGHTNIKHILRIGVRLQRRLGYLWVCDILADNSSRADV